VISAAEDDMRSTTDLLETWVPGAGRSSKTVPAGWELGLATTREVSPASSSR
jgi:hypothetical protein